MSAISSWIIIASVSGAVLLLCLFIVCCLVLLTCLYSSHCVWCPCNRKRGQARLQYMGSRGAISSHSTMNISKKQTNTGVTIYHGTSRREMVLSPTPSTPCSIESSSTVDHTQVFGSSFLVPVPRLSNSIDNRESCIYVLPNNMSTCLPNDGFVPTSSWGRGYILENGVIMANTNVAQESMIKCPTHVFIREVSRVEAEEILKKCGIIGCFLFRRTSSGICLSLLAPDHKCRHLMVDYVDGKYKIKSLPTGSECFASLEEFVGYYMWNKVHFQDGGLSVSFSKPC